MISQREVIVAEATKGHESWVFFANGTKLSMVRNSPMFCVEDVVEAVLW